MGEKRIFTTRKKKFKLWMSDSMGVHYDYGTHETLNSAEKQAKGVLAKHFPSSVVSFGGGEFIYKGKIYDTTTNELVKEITFEQLKITSK